MERELVGRVEAAPEIKVVLQGAGPPGKGIPPGGAPGQALVKKSGQDYDTEWGAPPRGIEIGDGLRFDESGKLAVDTAKAVEQDNTKPVTSAAVYTEIGNIEVLLAAL